MSSDLSAHYLATVQAAIALRSYLAPVKSDTEADTWFDLLSANVGPQAEPLLIEHAVRFLSDAGLLDRHPANVDWVRPHPRAEGIQGPAPSGRWRVRIHHTCEAADDVSEVEDICLDTTLPFLPTPGMSIRLSADDEHQIVGEVLVDLSIPGDLIVIELREPETLRPLNDMQREGWRLRKGYAEPRKYVAAREKYRPDEPPLAGVLEKLVTELDRAASSAVSDDGSGLEPLLSHAADLVANVITPRLAADWSEEFGAVLWWRAPIGDPAYCGSPLDTNWPGGFSHWTPMLVPMALRQDAYTDAR
jgi:hypothetical protein